MANGTVAVKTVSSLRGELKRRVPKKDSFSWYVFNKLPEQDQDDIIVKCRQISILISGLGVVGAFELIWRAELYHELHIEKPWIVHDLRKMSDDISECNKQYSNGGSKG